MQPARTTRTTYRTRDRTGARFGESPASGGNQSVRVSVAIQFTSQVAPPSAENACSNRADLVETCVMTNRTRIGLPSNVSSLKNSPRPFAKLPIDGGLISPLRLFAKLRLQRRVSGL